MVVSDVNKAMDTDYAKQIVSWKPKILIEIHGHGGTSANHDIEISSGSLANECHSIKLADKLRTELANIDDLKGLTISGEYNKLYFKASGSVTISDNNGWVAYHIELPPEVRKSLNSSDSNPPEAGYRFCDALIKAVKEIHS